MIELIRKRRSIRKFQDKPIEQDKIDILIESLLRSPTSRNIRPCEFVVVDDKKIIEKLSICKMHGSAFMAEAPLAIVIAADRNQSDVWVEDCSIASILLQLSAESLELGSCWVQIRNRQKDKQTTSEEYVQELLGIPDHIRVESIIAIGYPNEIKPMIPDSDLNFSKIRKNHY